MAHDPQHRTARIAILLDHPGIGDSRVLATLRALQKAGHNMALFTLHRHNATPDVTKPTPISDDFEGLNVQAVHLDNRTIVPGWHQLAQWRKRRRKSQASPTRLEGVSQPNRRTPPPKLKKRRSIIGSVNALLGALFWHKAVAKVMQGPVQRFRPDIVLANDLSMLGAGTDLARKTGATLIYDAHEYEAGRNGVQSSVEERVRQAFEAKFIVKANAVVTVSESLSAQLAYDHTKLPPICVIPNAASLQTNSPDRSWRREPLKDPESKLALYVGSAAPGRGLEPLLAAICDLPAIELAYLGRAEPERLDALQRMAENLGVGDRFHILPPVPPDDVTGYIAGADFSVIPIQPTCTSYRLCLPNKLFQSFATGTPVIATPLPEISATLRYVGGGYLADGYDAEALRKAFETAMKASPESPTVKLQKSLKAYGRDAADKRWTTLISNVLQGRDSLADIDPLPHARHVKFKAGKRPKNEIVPRGWTRLFGTCLVQISAPWTCP